MVFGVPIKVFSGPALASLNCLSATHSSTSINYLQAFSPSLLLIFKAEDSALCTGCVVTGAQVSIAPTFTPSLHLSPTSHQLFNLCVYYYYHYPQLNLNLVLSRTATTTLQSRRGNTQNLLSPAAHFCCSYHTGRRLFAPSPRKEVRSSIVKTMYQSQISCRGVSVLFSLLVLGSAVTSAQNIILTGCHVENGQEQVSHAS